MMKRLYCRPSVVSEMAPEYMVTVRGSRVDTNGLGGNSQPGGTWSCHLVIHDHSVAKSCIAKHPPTKQLQSKGRLSGAIRLLELHFHLHQLPVAAPVVEPHQKRWLNQTTTLMLLGWWFGLFLIKHVDYKYSQACPANNRHSYTTQRPSSAE